MSDFPSPLPTPLPSTTAPGAAVSTLVTRGRRKPGSSRSTRRISRHLRAIRISLTGMILLAVLYTVVLGKSLLVPLVLAAFIGLALNPIVVAAARVRFPRWLAAVIVMVTLNVGLVSAIATLSTPALNWFHEAPTAMRAFAPKIKPMTQQIEAASRATQNLVGGAVTRNAPQANAGFAFTAWDIVAGAPKVLASVLTVALLVFFFLVYGDEILRRAVEISPTFAYKRHTVSIVRSIQVEVSSYLLLTAAINVTLGLVTAGMLYLYGVPDPLLWGTVATVANFIPYVGAITTTTVLAVVGVLHFQEVGPALLPAATFAGITAIEGNLLTPMLQGRRSRLSPVAILLWLLIWGWLWGIPGALLAVPMLTCVKLVTAKLRGWEWFAHIISR
ncbi:MULTISPECIES: AI-2E family transporter [Rhodanobacteraceae]|uniref:AI-2E family transporter n=1 Tax=Rhodanobacteraceae TaxID=1775411 RepID=UPI00056BAD40|nr:MULTISPECIES: AI-2E family transporter [Rhodanobacteraceae]MDR6642356.1 putative PurR-regulated permease PerM [Luteibacter sp. 1214]SDG21150.1 Predicted PurR-regulated permease PerM [Dyella sp. 333MFSha]